MNLTEFLLLFNLNRRKYLYAGGFSLMLAVCPAQAREVVFSYCSPDEGIAFVGTSKAEPYDVAITLADPGLKGAKVVGMEVPLNLVPDIADLSAWISTELKLEVDEATGKKKNSPDFCSVDAAMKNGVLAARFDTPYTIGDSPVYVGYSFRIPAVGKDENDPARYPVAVAVGVEPGALMMHTQRHYLQWGDRGEALGGKSALKVILDGDFPSVSGSMEGIREVKCQGDNEKVILPVNVRSYGSDPIESLTVGYSYQGKSGQVEVKLDSPVQPIFGQPFSVNVEVPNDFDLGSEMISLTLDKINGIPNDNPARETSFALSMLRLFPKKRPVVEEYTGLWCGWCPRGYVGMETMSAAEPEFIGVAIHNSDPMEVTADFPSPVSGFPSCYVDRSGGAKSPSASSLKKYWGERSLEYTPVEINVSASRNDSNPKDIDVTSSFRFVEAPANPCRISYMLLANGLTDPDWEQKNFFSSRYEEGMDMFYGAPASIFGLVYNDVLVMFSSFPGEAGSVPAPADIVPYEMVSHDYTFHTGGSLSMSGYDLIGAAGDNLTVVALMTDSVTGEVVNAAKVSIGESGVAQTVADATVLKTEYVNLAGMKVDAPDHGMYIKVSYMSDGTVKAEKKVVK